MADPAPTKRPYRIDPQVAHERARIGARARNSPDTYGAAGPTGSQR